jgi:hypothetical protein
MGLGVLRPRRLRFIVIATACTNASDVWRTCEVGKRGYMAFGASEPGRLRSLSTPRPSRLLLIACAFIGGHSLLGAFAVPIEMLDEDALPRTERGALLSAEATPSVVVSLAPRFHGQLRLPTASDGAAHPQTFSPTFSLSGLT